jgi:hypothetical protein
MKNYLLTLILVLTSYLSFGQANYQDVVYLKNGSIIRGLVIEQVINKSIKIETADRSVFVYQMEEIEKITKEPFQGRNRNSHNNFGMKTGYKGMVEMGYEFKVGDYGMDRFKLNIIHGSQINPYFSFGIGTGLRYYSLPEAALIPLFMDLRTNFIDNNVSPYFSLGVGYSFDATNEFEGVGLLMNPTLGVSIKVGNKSAMNVGLGYEMQQMKFYTSYYSSRTVMHNSGAISLNVGISF